MSLSEQDRDTIELIATKVAEKFTEAQATAVQGIISHHQQTCPYGRRLLESRWFLAGVGAVFMLLTAGGSALGSWLLKVMTGI